LAESSDPAIQQLFHHDAVYAFVLGDLALRAFGNFSLDDLYEVHRSGSAPQVMLKPYRPFRRLSLVPSEGARLREERFHEVGAQTGFLYHPEPEELKVCH